ncbi:MAG: hypothetical protein ABI364_05955, partial [Caldimonas sp.]
MPTLPLRWSETWRVLAYTAAIALAFIFLGRLEYAAFDALGPGDMLLRASADEDAALAREAETVAAASRGALAAMPGRRVAAFAIGYHLGYASSFMGSLAMSSPELQAKARFIGDRHLALARELGAPLGLGALALLPVDNPQQYATLTRRFEADENGVAERIGQRLSPLHRQLYLLGAQLGNEASTVETTNGELTQPPAGLIRRHATLSGIGPALWRPLAFGPRGEQPAQALARYRTALAALGVDLAASDSREVGDTA